MHGNPSSSTPAAPRWVGSTWPGVRRAARDLLIVQLAQGVIGYVQYFTDLPIALVLLHMLGAVLITTFTARLAWSVRGPSSEVPLGAPSEPAAAAR